MHAERAAQATLPSTTAAPREARKIVRDALFAWGHRVLVEPAQLLMSELVTNAVLHGGPGEITVRLFADANRVRIEVFDQNVSAMPQLRLPPHDESSRGLHIVEAVASSWGCSPDGDRKVVWCELDLALADAQ